VCTPGGSGYGFERLGGRWRGLEETIGRQDKTIAEQERLIDGQNEIIARQEARIGTLKPQSKS
jgi:hypothetical protein